jgi:hypothetical protein
MQENSSVNAVASGILRRAAKIRSYFVLAVVRPMLDMEDASQRLSEEAL